MDVITGFKAGRLKVALTYILMLAGTAVIFSWIQKYGVTLAPPAGVGAVAENAVGSAPLDKLLHVLLALAVVIITARTLGAIFSYLQQPPVIGEVLGGILLGPSLLGRIAPELSHYVLPASTAPDLGIIAQVGVILFMFLVGLELDTGVIRKSGHATLAISHASIVAPFLLGSALAAYIYTQLAPPGVDFTIFALFMGVSMSITAFPVLARILTDRGISKTRMGVISLTCAAVDDVTAWCLLAVVVSLTRSQLHSGLYTIAFTIGYIALMFLVIRPLAAKFIHFCESVDKISRGMMAIVFIALLLSALATEFIGIHAIFGAFLLGAVIPHESRVAKDMTDRLQDLVSVLFLPAFFAFTGMRTQIGLLNSSSDWILCGGIIVIASLGKFGGTFVAAKVTGLKWRDAASLGVLMNTRGLVELIVLNIGLDLKVLTPTLFAMMVIMALVTTLMTTPILHLLTRKHPWEVIS